MELFCIGTAFGRETAVTRPGHRLAIIAAAVDIVGVLINLVVLPNLAQSIYTGGGPIGSILVIFQAMENLANALTNVTAFGLYSVAGLLLLPSIFATSDYPRWLARLGAVEWGVALIATILLVAAPGIATIPF